MVSQPGELSGEAPLVLLVDRDDRLRHVLARVLERQGFRVETAAEAQQALKLAQACEIDIALVDLQLQGQPDGRRLLEDLQRLHPETVTVVLTAGGGAAETFASLNAGAFDYFEKPIQDWTRFGQVLRNAWKVRELTTERDHLRQLAAQRDSAGLARIIGRSPAISQLRQLVGRVASVRVPVLVLGESGSGKELVARALHGASTWGEKPFVDVNCAAIPDTLLESELFGHERGAFTGADQRKAGLFEVAGEGTLFLDEIAELPYDLQAKLLRVLGSGEFRRVGGTRNIPWRARLVTATNKDIPALVRAGTFREDLYYRLNVVDIRVPPLRDRRDDIPLLVWYFVDRFNRTYDKQIKRITTAAMRALSEADWRQNNVRQLENAVERALVLADGDELTIALFRDRLPVSSGLPATAAQGLQDQLPEQLLQLSYREAKALVVERFSRAYITSKLRQAGGNIAEAARRSGQERPNFRKLMKRFGVPSPGRRRG